MLKFKPLEAKLKGLFKLKFNPLVPKLKPLEVKLNGAAPIPTFEALVEPRLNPLDAKLKGAVSPTLGLVLILKPFDAKLIEPISIKLKLKN